jgi:hypothetical protein
MSICKRCGRAVAVGLICTCALLSWHDVPHTHEEEKAPQPMPRQITVIASTSSATTSGGISWHIPPRRPSG